jgi:putative ABC transport system permease protein
MQNMNIKVGDRIRSVNVSGVTPAYGLLRNMIPAPGGRFINPIDVERRRRVAFVGDSLADDLFGDDDPVGREVTLHGSPFTIVGVLEHKSQDSSYGAGRDTEKVIIPATTFRALTGRRSIDVFVFRGYTADGNAEVIGRVVETLAARKRYDPADNGALNLWDTTEMFVMFNAMMLGFKIFLGMMGVITLTVGGIGVSNIMNVVVEERTREIGIKLALGARPRAIMFQFLTETLIVTGIGGLIGIGITAGICALFGAPEEGNLFAEAIGRPEFSPGVGMLTAGILGLVGLIAGYFPARDAAKLDPVVAMKL